MFGRKNKNKNEARRDCLRNNPSVDVLNILCNYNVNRIAIRGKNIYKRVNVKVYMFIFMCIITVTFIIYLFK
jgi:hypothetical protein